MNLELTEQQTSALTFILKAVIQEGVYETEDINGEEILRCVFCHAEAPDPLDDDLEHDSDCAYCETEQLLKELKEQEEARSRGPVYRYALRTEDSGFISGMYGIDRPGHQIHYQHITLTPGEYQNLVRFWMECKNNVEVVIYLDDKTVYKTEHAIP